VQQLDLVRFGRQPKEWVDDLANARHCQASGINLHGRPPSFSNVTDNERGLMRMLSETKFALAFSNRMSPDGYTHPDREYITDRWTDSLASGAVVAGVPPCSEPVQSLSWSEAFLDLRTANQGEGLRVIASDVREWAPSERDLITRNPLRTLTGAGVLRH
jgi:hypothetical protein